MTVRRYASKILDENPGSIAFIGVAYKRGVGLIDESQAIKILKRVLAAAPEVRVSVYDKLAEEKARKELPSTVFFCDSLQEAINRADVIFVGVPDSSLTKEMFQGKRVIDPWRCL